MSNRMFRSGGRAGSKIEVGVAHDEEQAIHEARRINARTRSHKKQAREDREAAAAKAKITLATTPWKDDGK